MMLSQPYLAASAADRSRGTTSFSCLILATSLSYVLTWVLSILLLQIDIGLEGMVIACFSPLNFLNRIDGRVEICYRFGVFSLTSYVCSRMCICFGAKSKPCLPQMEIGHLNNFNLLPMYRPCLLAILLP
jgi:hypothetical protein